MLYWPPDMYSICGGVDDLVEREQREVPRHELDDGRKPDHGRADATPANPSSVIGVSTTRISPNSCSSPETL
jgi:hypothetical protein